MIGRVLLLAGLVAPPLRAQEPDGPPATPAAAQRASLLAFGIPVVAGSLFLLPADASSVSVSRGAALVVTGAVFGPGLGYLNGGATGRGFHGMGIRAGITLAALASFDDPDAGLTLGAVALLGHALYDVARVRAVVARRQASLSLGPAPGWVRAPALGAQLAW